MQSSAKTVRSSPAPTSQPQPTPQPQPQPPEDPLVVQAILHIQEMDEGQLARSAGQILYDIAIQDPAITIGTMEVLGMILKKTILSDSGKFLPEWLPLLRRYIRQSMVARDPRLVAMAFTRIVTIQLYAAGKLENAHQAHNASA